MVSTFYCTFIHYVLEMTLCNGEFRNDINIFFQKQCFGFFTRFAGLIKLSLAFEKVDTLKKQIFYN